MAVYLRSTFGQPSQVGVVSIHDRQDDELGHVVRVEIPDAFPQAGDALARRLDHDLALGLALDAPLPAIDGFHLRQQVDAGRQPVVNERPRERGRIGIHWKRGQYDHVIVSHSGTSDQSRGFSGGGLYSWRARDESIVQRTVESTMPPVLEQKPENTRPGGPEPLRRKRVVPAPAPASPLRRRAVQYLLVFVTVVLVVDGLVGDRGLLERLRARRQHQEAEESLAKLRRENNRLRTEIRGLKEDGSAIEALAREELGLIRPGELIFIIRDTKPASH